MSPTFLADSFRDTVRAIQSAKPNDNGWRAIRKTPSTRIRIRVHFLRSLRGLDWKSEGQGKKKKRKM